MCNHSKEVEESDRSCN